MNTYRRYTLWYLNPLQADAFIKYIRAYRRHTLRYLNALQADAAFKRTISYPCHTLRHFNIDKSPASAESIIPDAAYPLVNYHFVKKMLACLPRHCFQIAPIIHLPCPVDKQRSILDLPSQILPAWLYFMPVCVQLFISICGDYGIGRHPVSSLNRRTPPSENITRSDRFRQFPISLPQPDVHAIAVHLPSQRIEFHPMHFIQNPHLFRILRIQRVIQRHSPFRAVPCNHTVAHDWLTVGKSACLRRINLAFGISFPIQKNIIQKTIHVPHQEEPCIANLYQMRRRYLLIPLITGNPA